MKTSAPDNNLLPAAASTAATACFAIEGMTCGNCVRHVTQAIQDLAKVRTVEVSLEAGRAQVQWADQPAPQAVVAAVQKAGFQARLLDSEAASAPPRRDHGWRTNLWIGGLGTIPLMIGEWLLGLGATPWFQWTSLVLAGMVQVLAGARFYRGAWLQLQRRQANMDTLVSLGSTTAFIFSVSQLLTGGHSHLYFLEAAAIITLISLGHWLEARMSAHAADALQKLLQLAPPPPAAGNQTVRNGPCRRPRCVRVM